MNQHLTAEERVDIAKRCTWTGFAVNGLLSVLKILAGFIGHSGAMIADGIHSASDFITDIIVVVFMIATTFIIFMFMNILHFFY